MANMEDWLAPRGVRALLHCDKQNIDARSAAMCKIMKDKTKRAGAARITKNAERALTAPKVQELEP
eukprot:7651879-Heterocapsa_arctica.AAC.1